MSIKLNPEWVIVTVASIGVIVFGYLMYMEIF